MRAIGWPPVEGMRQRKCSGTPIRLANVNLCEKIPRMTYQLESLKKHSLVVADTGDIEAVARWKPQDATTNPSLLLTSAQDPRFRHLVDKAIGDAKGDTTAAMD